VKPEDLSGISKPNAPGAAAPQAKPGDKDAEKK